MRKKYSFSQGYNRSLSKFLFFSYLSVSQDDSEGKESACNAGDQDLIPRVGKIPWRKTWQPTPVFLPGEPLWTEEPGRLQFIGSQRVGHDWATKHFNLLRGGHILALYHQSTLVWVRRQIKKGGLMERCHYTWASWQKWFKSDLILWTNYEETEKF